MRRLGEGRRKRSFCDRKFQKTFLPYLLLQASRFLEMKCSVLVVAAAVAAAAALAKLRVRTTYKFQRDTALESKSKNIIQKFSSKRKFLCLCLQRD